METSSTPFSNTVVFNSTTVYSNDHSENESTSTGSWIWVVCVTVIILLLVPVTLLLVPRIRKRLQFLPLRRRLSAHQEMPQTKQDVTEIQWDLAWMEMANLMDKQSPGS